MNTCDVMSITFLFAFYSVATLPLPRYNHTEYIYQCRRTMLVISAVELAFHLLLLPWAFGSVQDSPARYLRHDRSMYVRHINKRSVSQSVPRRL